jgi:hypothetical protein
VVLKALLDYGDPWDHQRVEQFVHDLAAIGVELGPKRNWPAAPLEPLADDGRRRQFLLMMERTLDTLTSSP